MYIGEKIRLNGLNLIVRKGNCFDCKLNHLSVDCKNLLSIDGFHYPCGGLMERGHHFQLDESRKLDNKEALKEMKKKEGEEWDKSHYDFMYELTKEEIENGKIRIDPYLVTRIWKLNTKDDTGILFHNLKTVCRYGTKNTKEREIKAMFNQIKRLAELENVKL